MDEKEIIPWEDKAYPENTPQWLERYEYIERRSEFYLVHFRDSVEYDFTRLTESTRKAQGCLSGAYELFVSGEITVNHVKEAVIAFKNAHRKTVEERPPGGKPPPPKNFPGYTPYFQALKRFNEAINKHLFFCGKRRPKDIDSVCVETGEGYLADGTPTDGAALYGEIVNRLYNEFMILPKTHVTYIVPVEEEFTLAPLSPHYELPIIEEGDAPPARRIPKQKSIDELKAEYEAEERRKASLTRTERKQEREKNKK
jgi:hypothetical protein